MSKKPIYIVRQKVPNWAIRQYQYWKYVMFKRWKFVLTGFVPFVFLLIYIDFDCWKYDNPTNMHHLFKIILSSVGAFIDCHFEKYVFQNTFTVSSWIVLCANIIVIFTFVLGLFEHNRMIKSLSYRLHDYKGVNFKVDNCEQKPIAQSIFLINQTFNQVFRSNKFSEIPVEFKGCFKLDPETKELAWRGLEYFRYQHKVLWNDKKVRLHTPIENLLTSNRIRLMETTYFDYLGTGLYSMKKWYYKNKEIYDGISLFYDTGAKEILDLTKTRTAHHIGVNALLITKDKKFIIQETSAKAAPDKYAPSGSGSLDIADINDQSFGQTLLNGALREFAQETGWAFIKKHAWKSINLEPIDNFKKFPLGMSVDIGRGMITDFFFLIIAENTSSTEYLNHYKNRSIKVDEFEVHFTNAIITEDIIVDTGKKNITTADIIESLNRIKTTYSQCSMLTISINFIIEFLQDNSEQSKKLIKFLKN